MSYSIGQYFHLKNTEQERFMSQQNILVGLVGNNAAQTRDISVKIENNNFKEGTSYYFNCEILPVSVANTFKIKLCNSDNMDKFQIIKTVTVPAGGNKEVDVAFIFTPLIDFDMIVIEVARPMGAEADEYRQVRILMKEISIMHNILSNLVQAHELAKISVKAAPGVRLCINHEDMIVGKTGVYEIKNGIVAVDYFSVAAPAGRDDLAAVRNDLWAKNEFPAREYLSAANASGREIPDFILDYVYDDKN